MESEFDHFLRNQFSVISCMVAHQNCYALSAMGWLQLLVKVTAGIAVDLATSFLW